MADTNAPEVIEKEQGRFALTGDVFHEHVKEITEKGESVITNSSSDVLIDLSELGAVNTVAVAVLLQWIRTAKTHSIELSIQSAPKKLINIITFSGLQPVFKEYLETV